MHIRHLGKLEHFQHQTDDLDITGSRRIAIQLSPQLDRAARGGKRLRLGMQHTTGIAQATGTFATQGMRVDPGHLWRDISPQPHLATGKRVDDLERTQIQILPGTGEQRLEKLHVRGDDQLVAPALEQVQHAPTRRFDTRRLRRQHLFDAIWQKPAVYRCHSRNHLSFR